MTHMSLIRLISPIMCHIWHMNYLYDPNNCSNHIGVQL